MSNNAKNETAKDTALFNFLQEKREFVKTWEQKKTQNKQVSTILKNASKGNTQNRGEPDLLYVNEDNKLLIIIENKDSIQDHNNEDKKKDDISKYAVSGARHYLSFFKVDNLRNRKLEDYFQNWKIVGVATSGDINSEYGHKIDTFILNTDKTEVKDIDKNNLLDEQDYIALFESFDIEEIVNTISTSSETINRMLRSMDSQKRPVILSSLMICLFERQNGSNDFLNDYMGWGTDTIINNIPTTIDKILQQEGLPREKIEILKNQFQSSIQDEKDMSDTDLLKDTLKELQDNVIPLFKTKTNYDIIGKFYEEFLRYAGVTNVKNGIVLTPSHITKLFTELIDIKTNDVIFDPACGTGSFLISGMNTLIDTIEASDMPNKKEKIQQIKSNQLIGFEKNPTMFSLSISNMLFRGDGKSRIYHLDFFKQEADQVLNQMAEKPTIGFVNPPYGGMDNPKNPTKKEIQFLSQLLDSCSRYVVIIAPLSVFFKDDDIRDKILTKHSLKYVINMPVDLFQPNASTHTAIAVFETNKPHNEQEVVMYDLKDDGLILSKHKGRTDSLDRWSKIKKQMLEEIQNSDQYADDFHCVKTPIKKGDEWIIQAHSKTDYSSLQEKDFVRTIQEYVIFSTKRDLNLLDKQHLDELDLLEILNNNNIDGESFFKEKI